MGTSGTKTEDTIKIVHDSKLDEFLSDHLFTKDGLLEVSEEEDPTKESTLEEEGFPEKEKITEDVFDLPEDIDIDFTKPVDDTTELGSDNNNLDDIDDFSFELPDDVNTSIEVDKEKDLEQEEIPDVLFEEEIAEPEEATEEATFGQDNKTQKEDSKQKEEKSTKKSSTDDAQKNPESKKKRTFLILILLSIIIGGAVAIFFFMQNNKEIPITEEITEIEVEEPEEVPLLEEQIVEWEPFWLDKSTDKKVVFFTIKFTTQTRSASVLEEAREKEHLIRDAVYFYLQKVKTDELDKNTSEHLAKIKKDILGIINGFLTTGTFPEIGIENILVQ